MAATALSDINVADKRRHPRVDVGLRGTIRLSPGAMETEATVVNFARGGVYVRSASTPPLGTPVALRFRMLLEHTYEAHGHVVRWDREHGGFGVAFAETNAAMEEFAHYLTKLPAPLRPVYLADVLYLQLEATA